MYLKIPTLFMLLIFPCFMYSQQHIEKMIDKNPVYAIEGIGYNESGVKKLMNFSKLSAQGEDKGEIMLTNNEIEVTKNGIYRISVSSEINKNPKDKQQPIFAVHINGKEAFVARKGNLSAEGEYYFQIQLKKGDVLSFSIVDEAITAMEKNSLRISFTDPALITFSEQVVQH
ncbi:hypothetical protein [Chryseobacterium viscerum]|nr:hypothetical protein [Chryseobacterium viscerum]